MMAFRVGIGDRIIRTDTVLETIAGFRVHRQAVRRFQSERCPQ
jgi:hypothetical protein